MSIYRYALHFLSLAGGRIRLIIYIQALVQSSCRQETRLRLDNGLRRICLPVSR